MKQEEEVSPSSVPSAGEAKGAEEDRVHAIAFRGSGLDAVFELGVIHAWVVTARRPPDVVAGISLGALNAAALAEVLQETSFSRQLDRLRQFIIAYTEAPEELARVLWPDANEVRAQDPLRSIRLPIYQSAEREHRDKSVQRSFGLINLINDLLAMRLRVSDLARVAYLCLEMRAATNNRHDLAKWLLRAWLYIQSLSMISLALWRAAPLFHRLFWESAEHRSGSSGAFARRITRQWHHPLESLKSSTGRITATAIAYWLLIGLPVCLLLTAIWELPCWLSCLLYGSLAC